MSNKTIFQKKKSEESQKEYQTMIHFEESIEIVMCIVFFIGGINS